MTKIIELKKVNKWFDKFQVLKDIDLDVSSQEKKRRANLFPLLFAHGKSQLTAPGPLQW